MVTLKADNRSRVKLPDIKPGTVFAFELSGNVMKLTAVKPVEEDEVPVVKLIRGQDGLYSFPEGKRPSREEIKRYLRAERDGQ